MTPIPDYKYNVSFVVGDRFKLQEYRNDVGELHRSDGPAIVYDNGYEYWLNGKRHRSDGPAVYIKYKDHPVIRQWWQNGELHRSDGPAVEWGDVARQWRRNGLLHRSDGPAVIRPDGGFEYWLNGRPITESDFYKKKRISLKYNPS